MTPLRSHHIGTAGNDAVERLGNGETVRAGCSGRQDRRRRLGAPPGRRGRTPPDRRAPCCSRQRTGRWQACGRSSMNERSPDRNRSQRSGNRGQVAVVSHPSDRTRTCDCPASHWRRAGGPTVHRNSYGGPSRRHRLAACSRACRTSARDGHRIQRGSPCRARSARARELDAAHRSPTSACCRGSAVPPWPRQKCSRSKHGQTRRA